ncbi:MAG: helix-turn-helix domain-containing protein [Halioglobus sp.]
MTDDVSRQLDAFITPGTLLKAARQAQDISEREAADRLNLMPNYVAILERDDYKALRSPPFARGYVKAYGKLLGLDEEQLLGAFDRLRDSAEIQQQRRVETRPLQLQRTGFGVVIGLAVLFLLVLALWWWRGDGAKTVIPAESTVPQAIPGESSQTDATGAVQ